jgi:hypothetical protein
LRSFSIFFQVGQHLLDVHSRRDVLAVGPVDLFAALVLGVGDPVVGVDAEVLERLVLGLLAELLVDLRDLVLADLVVGALEVHEGVVAGRDDPARERLTAACDAGLPIEARQLLLAVRLERAGHLDLGRLLELGHALSRDLHRQRDVRALDRGAEGLLDGLLRVPATAAAAAAGEQRHKRQDRKGEHRA